MSEKGHPSPNKPVEEDCTRRKRWPSNQSGTEKDEDEKDIEDSEAEPDNVSTEAEHENAPTKAEPENAPTKAEPDNAPNKAESDNALTEAASDNASTKAEPDNASIEAAPDNAPTDGKEEIEGQRPTDVDEIQVQGQDEEAYWTMVTEDIGQTGHGTVMCVNEGQNTTGEKMSQCNSDTASKELQGQTDVERSVESNPVPPPPLNNETTYRDDPSSSTMDETPQTEGTCTDVLDHTNHRESTKDERTTFGSINSDEKSEGSSEVLAPSRPHINQSSSVDSDNDEDNQTGDSRQRPSRNVNNQTGRPIDNLRILSFVRVRPSSGNHFGSMFVELSQYTDFPSFRLRIGNNITIDLPIQGDVIPARVTAVNPDIPQPPQQTIQQPSRQPPPQPPPQPSPQKSQQPPRQSEPSNVTNEDPDSPTEDYSRHTNVRSERDLGVKDRYEMLWRSLGVQRSNRLRNQRNPTSHPASPSTRVPGSNPASSTVSQSESSPSPQQPNTPRTRRPSANSDLSDANYCPRTRPSTQTQPSPQKDNTEQPTTHLRRRLTNSTQSQNSNTALSSSRLSQPEPTTESNLTSPTQQCHDTESTTPPRRPLRNRRMRSHDNSVSPTNQANASSSNPAHLSQNEVQSRTDTRTLHSDQPRNRAMPAPPPSSRQRSQSNLSFPPLRHGLNPQPQDPNYTSTTSNNSSMNTIRVHPPLPPISPNRHPPQNSRQTNHPQSISGDHLQSARTNQISSTLSQHDHAARANSRISGSCPCRSNRSAQNFRDGSHHCHRRNYLVDNPVCYVCDFNLENCSESILRVIHLALILHRREISNNDHVHEFHPSPLTHPTDDFGRHFSVVSSPHWLSELQQFPPRNYHAGAEFYRHVSRGDIIFTAISNYLLSVDVQRPRDYRYIPVIHELISNQPYPDNVRNVVQELCTKLQIKPRKRKLNGAQSLGKMSLKSLESCRQGHGDSPATNSSSSPVPFPRITANAVTGQSFVRSCEKINNWLRRAWFSRGSSRVNQLFYDPQAQEETLRGEPQTREETLQDEAKTQEDTFREQEEREAQQFERQNHDQVPQIQRRRHQDTRGASWQQQQEREQVNLESRSELHRRTPSNESRLQQRMQQSQGTQERVQRAPTAQMLVQRERGRHHSQRLRSLPEEVEYRYREPFMELTLREIRRYAIQIARNYLPYHRPVQVVRRDQTTQGQTQLIRNIHRAATNGQVPSLRELVIDYVTENPNVSPIRQRQFSSNTIRQLLWQICIGYYVGNTERANNFFANVDLTSKQGSVTWVAPSTGNSFRRKPESSRDSQRQCESSRDSQRQCESSQESMGLQEPCRDSQEKRESSRDSQKQREHSRSSPGQHESSRDSQRQCESSRDSQRQCESSRDSQRQCESSQESMGLQEPCRDSQEKRESSRDSQTQREHSRSSPGQHESSRDSQRQCESSRGSQGERESSQDSQRQRESSRNSPGQRESSRDSQRQCESSRDSQRQCESSQESMGQHEPSRDSQGKRESSRDSQRQREHSRNSPGQRESSLDSQRKCESSLDSQRQCESSRGSQGERESSQGSQRQRESSRNSPGQRESSRNSPGQRESSRDSQRHCESSRDSQRHCESSRDSQRHCESSRDSQRQCESSRDSQRQGESSRDSQGKCESSRDSQRQCESSQESMGQHEPSRDSQGKRESSRDSQRQREHSRSSPGQRESSLDSQRQCESSRGSQGERESSQDSQRQRESSRNSPGQRESSRDSQRHCESSRDSQRQCESSRNNQRQCESSRNSQRQGESNRDSQGKCESSRDSQGQCESNRDSQGQRESSRDSQGQCESSRDKEVQCESSRDSQRQDESSRDSQGKCESSRDSQRRYETSQSSQRQCEPIRYSQRQGEPSRHSLGQRETSRDSLGRCESSRDSQKRRESCRDSQGQRESSPDSQVKCESSRDSQRQCESSRDSQRHDESSRDSQRLCEPSRHSLGQRETSRDSLGRCESSRGSQKRRESRRDMQKRRESRRGSQGQCESSRDSRGQRESSQGQRHLRGTELRTRHVSEDEGRKLQSKGASTRRHRRRRPTFLRHQSQKDAMAQSSDSSDSPSRETRTRTRNSPGGYALLSLHGALHKIKRFYTSRNAQGRSEKSSRATRKRGTLPHDYTSRGGRKSLDRERDPTRFVGRSVLSQRLEEMDKEACVYDYRSVLSRRLDEMDANGFQIKKPVDSQSSKHQNQANAGESRQVNKTGKKSDNCQPAERRHMDDSALNTQRAGALNWSRPIPNAKKRLRRRTSDRAKRHRKPGIDILPEKRGTKGPQIQKPVDSQPIQKQNQTNANESRPVNQKCNDKKPHNLQPTEERGHSGGSTLNIRRGGALLTSQPTTNSNEKSSDYAKGPSKSNIDVLTEKCESNGPQTKKPVKSQLSRHRNQTDARDSRTVNQNREMLDNCRPPAEKRHLGGSASNTRSQIPPKSNDKSRHDSDNAQRSHDSDIDLNADSTLHRLGLSSLSKYNMDEETRRMISQFSLSCRVELSPPPSPIRNAFSLAVDPLRHCIREGEMQTGPVLDQEQRSEHNRDSETGNENANPHSTLRCNNGSHNRLHENPESHKRPEHSIDQSTVNELNGHTSVISSRPRQGQNLDATHQNVDDIVIPNSNQHRQLPSSSTMNTDVVESIYQIMLRLLTLTGEIDNANNQLALLMGREHHLDHTEITRLFSHANSQRNLFTFTSPAANNENLFSNQWTVNEHNPSQPRAAAASHFPTEDSTRSEFNEFLRRFSIRRIEAARMINQIYTMTRFGLLQQAESIGNIIRQSFSSVLPPTDIEGNAPASSDTADANVDIQGERRSPMEGFCQCYQSRNADARNNTNDDLRPASDHAYPPPRPNSDNLTQTPQNPAQRGDSPPRQVNNDAPDDVDPTILTGTMLATRNSIVITDGRMVVTHGRVVNVDRMGATVNAERIVISGYQVTIFDGEIVFAHNVVPRGSPLTVRFHGIEPTHELSEHIQVSEIDVIAEIFPTDLALVRVRGICPRCTRAIWMIFRGPYDNTRPSRCLVANNPSNV